ncbi:TonB-dependent receptor domain-containing protein [Alteromonas oceanisediminis]|uniref:TonB-dependent receptor domain-containing protein n=1 Tax=Alteromonas oceanisediminis TaxID=2836180 RepID=UPI001BDA4799|nr:TonB-dependent receptor [Alteromonas oceanisediminis]MBT0587660.1 TonB-dependent receptor [Alteromonas oceanisediminis]
MKTYSLRPTAKGIIIALTGSLLTSMPSVAQQNSNSADKQAQEKAEVITVTGSRIARTELTATSPVYTVNELQLATDQVVSVEDILRKLPQAAAGANSTGATVGDSLGASTIDLRGLGQNRTLVLVNGSRVVPFSFRNAVDVNAIPAGLIKRVEVLTGGAAAVYGADAVAGVVNFILDDQYEGFETTAGLEYTDGGGEVYNLDVTMGAGFDDGRGNVTAYVGYSKREALLAGDRDFTRGTATNVAGNGGNFTDVASGNSFAFNNAGDLVDEAQFDDIAPERFLLQPMERLSGNVFFNYDLVEDTLQMYGRAMITQVRVTGAGSTGQTPVSVSETISISQDSPFLTDAVSDLLTFDENGIAQVAVQKGLGLGLQETRTVRNTFQFQLGFRGDITDFIGWDIYGQYGRTDGTAKVYNNAIRQDFQGLANTRNIFGPTDFSDLSSPIIHSNRERIQSVINLTVSGDSADFFELPAGPIGFAIGYEYRDEQGTQTPGTALSSGTAYGLGGISLIDAEFDTKEIYGEILVPLLSDMPFIKELSVEAAYRNSDYSNVDSATTDKFGISWAVNDQLRFRATQQTAIRAPNLGEFAGPEVGLSLALFDPESASFIPRLGGRFDGDPCLDGRGDAAQCARLNAAAPGTEFDTSAALYTFGGNDTIQPEESETTSIGVVYTPDVAEGLDITLDYYDIEITDAVSQIQPIAALTSCYIDDPFEGNPLCGAVLRDPATGLISQTLVNDFNLASLTQSGFDVGVRLQLGTLGDSFENVTFSYQGNIVDEQSRQNNATVAALDCKGTFGSSCTGDFASILQADYRHRATVDFEVSDIAVQLGWRYIGDVVLAGPSNDVDIDAQSYLDVSATYRFADAYEVTFGIDNLLDEEPPLPESGANFFGTVSDYDTIGRTIGVTFRFRP